MTATTIDGVLDQLTAIIDEARTGSTRMGYFAVVYHLITVAIKEGIAANRFDDGPRMERFDVNFANRYLAAYEQYQRGDPCSQAWRVAFDNCQLSSFMILQHLLLGINAHINLDLAVAAVQTAPGDDLASLERDFNEINVVLATMVKTIQRRIGAASPWLGLLDFVGGRTDEVIVNFSMTKARQSAWEYAQKLAALGEDEQTASIARRDEAVANLASIITQPGLTLGMIVFLIWLRESREVATIMDLLVAE